MSKKEYITPLIEVEMLNTAKMMSAASESEYPVNPAPPRRSKVF